ncbi:hypothetical protein DSUL_60060 [Desulfovibrionales bacterium]
MKFLKYPITQIPSIFRRRSKKWAAPCHRYSHLVPCPPYAPAQTPTVTTETVNAYQAFVCLALTWTNEVLHQIQATR